MTPAIYVLLVAMAWWIEYPGQLNLDSLDQLTQAAYPEFLNDWHSPGVTWLWSLGTIALGQPGGALMTQCLLVMAFPAVVIARTVQGGRRLPERAWSIAYAASCLSWIAISGLILKDAVLLGAISVFLAVVSQSDWSKSSTYAGLCCVILLIGVIRPTNFMLVAVAMACCTATFIDRSEIRSAHVGAGVAMIVLTALINPIVNRTGLHAQDSHAAEQLIIFDLAGISTESGTDVFAELPGWPSTSLAKPWTCYTPNHWDDFAWWGPCKGYVQAFEAVRQKVGDTPTYGRWLNAVVSHPLAYAKHRLRYLSALLLNRKPFVTGYPNPENKVGGAALSGTSSTHGKDMRDALQMWSNSVGKIVCSLLAIVLFRGHAVPSLALAACVAVLLFVRLQPKVRSGPHAVLATLTASIGVANVAMLALFGVADDGRYLIPTLCCAYAACFELGIEVLRQRNVRSSTGTGAPRWP